MAAPYKESMICPVLIDRIGDLATLQALLEQARSGRGQVVLLSGEAGVGKSRLVAEVKTHAAAQDFLLLQGSCFPTDHAIPYAPLLDLVRSSLTSHSSALPSTEIETVAQVFLPLLPDLGHVFTGEPPSPILPPLDPEQEKRRRFTLPPEHVPVLAQEGGPVFFGGVQEELVGMAGPVNQLMQAFRNGGGVPMEAYDPSAWEGLTRFTNGWFENLLVPVWLPAMPEVLEKLESGALVADVGCGHGKALIKLAQTYPQSRYVGYDQFALFIEQAQANAEAAGVADRVRFEHRDVSAGLPEQYDVITTFDVVHDAVNPRRLLRTIRNGLKLDGRYVCLEINSSDRLEENIGLLGAFFYSVSVLYCMTSSLAHHGEGLGTAGVPESKMRELCAEAGFSNVCRVPMENPFNILYEVTP